MYCTARSTSRPDFASPTPQHYFHHLCSATYVVILPLTLALYFACGLLRLHSASPALGYLAMLRSRAFGSVALARPSYQGAKVLNTSSQLLPADCLLEEERNPDYDPKRFYPARVGGTVQKYELISKLGWGTASTVWLAKYVKRFVQWPSQQVDNNRGT